MSYSIDEVHYLIAHNADITCHLATRSFAPRDALTDATYLREHLGEYGRAAMELGRARRTAARKQLPADWIVCHESAQQATPLPVARVRAARLGRALGPGARIHDITCSIGTEGHALVAAGLQYLGSDLDPSRVTMARYNLGAALPTANTANKPQPAWGFHIADAQYPATIPGAADTIIADPARRHQGRRITDPDELLPPLTTILGTYPHTPMAIKCAPGIDFTGWDGLVSLVSVDGGVKEACLYSPALAAGLHREAVIIRDGTMDILTDRDDPGADTLVGEPGTYIIDPDGAVIRAGLVRHYAHRENLWLLDERIAYLTGDRIPAGMSGFPYIETVPLKKLRSVLRGHDCGSVEILVRGVDVDPDRLRQKLRLSGSRPMAVVCTRIGRSGVALVCEARVVGEPPAGQPIP